MNKVTTFPPLILAHPDLKTCATSVRTARAPRPSNRPAKFGMALQSRLMPCRPKCRHSATAPSPLLSSHKLLKRSARLKSMRLSTTSRPTPTVVQVSPAGTQPIPNQLLTKDTIDDPANANYIYKTTC